MKLTSTQPAKTPIFRCLYLFGIGGAVALAACSDDEAAPAPQPDFTIAVATLDGVSPEESVPLRCDGTLAVAVAITTSIPRVDFVLSPQGACGQSKRCGYVQVEGLDADGDPFEPVAKSVTTTAVLELGAEQRGALSSIRATLISGVDGTPIVNKDGSNVSALVSPSFTQPEGCDDGSGGAGAGGAPSLGGAGAGGAGAGGAAAGGAEAGGAGAGGAGEPLGGAGGEPNTVGGAGGAPSE